MKIAERSAQVWPLLAFAATHRQTLTYEMVSSLTGMHTPGVGSVLEPIQSYCLLKGFPPLTAVVVSKSTGLPGPGFVAAQDVPLAFMKVFAFDWAAVGCPTPDEFAEAVLRVPSNGIISRASEQPTTE